MLFDGVFSSVKVAANALRALSKEITANGLPSGAIRNTAHADRVLALALFIGL